jgi:hypothetical protein
VKDHIELFTIGFGRPDLVGQQKRLLDKYLTDSFGICLIDNSFDEQAEKMEKACHGIGVGYQRAVSKKHEHPDALDFAARYAAEQGYDYIGFLDHDVFPVRRTTLIDKLKAVGFYGIGQTHPATGVHYLWPGFSFFSKTWLGGRHLNFQGIRGEYKRDDGDCGSMNWPLFSEEDWRLLWGIEHGYEAIREPDEHGLQSWGIEKLGDWIHFTNASNWKNVPDIEERDMILTRMLNTL